MRLRNKKWAAPFIHEANDLVIAPSDDLKSSWNQIFNNNNPISLEIGMGKGDFITQLALMNPDINYIGIERFTTVLAIGAKKIKEKNILNLRLMVYDAANLDKIFNPNSLDAIYLNFSDPWPKKKHAKRRLTAKTFLNCYYQLLKANGSLIIKTDNLSFFDFTCESLKENNFIIRQLDQDYQFDDKSDGMSEYELRFRQQGIKINRIVAIKGN